MPILTLAFTICFSQSIPSITLMEKDASLERVLADIQRLTGYNYVLDIDPAHLPRPVTFAVKHLPLTALLDSCLGDAPIFFKLTGHFIRLWPGGLLRGRVVDEQGQGIAAATVEGLDPEYGVAVMSGEEGRFQLRLPRTSMSVVISCVGYETRRLSVSGAQVMPVALERKTGALQDVVVSDGLRDSPSDKRAGSFGSVSRELIERRVSPSLLDRMDGVTAGLLVNTNVYPGTNQSAITIRGRSTIFSNPDPLLIVDNFPYAGDVSTINPEDVESITVLKDAAAASIWGTRAANGVIVIKTRQGKYRQAPRLTFTTSVLVGQKPNLHYRPILSSSDYIDVEEYLFGQGFDDSKATSLNHPALSPVVELLLQQRAGLLTSADTAAQLGMLRQQDTRRDLSRYWYTPLVNRQYWLGLSGGSASHHYSLSAGLDKDQASLVRNGYDRITVMGNNTYLVIPQRLELTTDLAFTASTTYNNNTGSPGAVYPYLKLVGAGGSALAVPFQLREGYVDTAGSGQLLDWHYRPLDELNNANNVTRGRDLRLNAGAHYSLPLGLQLQALYQYGQGSTDQQNVQSVLMYYPRNLVNEFAQPGPGGQLSFPVPVGGILDETLSTYESHNGRLQLDYDHRFTGGHSLHLLAGSELQAVQGRTRLSRLYGYDPVSQSGLPVSSYTTLYTQYSSPGSQTTIPDLNNTTSSADHYWSYYANGSYQYRERLTVSASSRIDQSNLFGVNINRKSIPLWSAGVSWELSRQDFYTWRGWLPLLRMRLTNGYNGNVYKAVAGSTSAIATTSVGVNFGAQNVYGAPFAAITNPPNPDLRWEQVHVVDAGMDFSVKKDRLEGSLDYYTKQGRYLIGPTGLDPTSGNTQYIANVTNMVTHGVELSLHTRDSIGKISLTSALLFNYVQDRVTQFLVRPANIGIFLNPAYLSPLDGRPLYSVYALPWAGLDPTTGDPRGLLNGHASENYTAITTSSDFATLRYKGPADPPFFGSWQPTVSWKQWGLSLLFVYKFGNYFSRSSIQYFTLFNGTSLGHPDYQRRWQKPGDELHTYVPSMTYPASSVRDFFYASSEVLIEKGDLIRLQDLQLFYDLPKKAIPRLKALRFYCYINHLALLWTANRQGIDPDAQTSLPPVRTFAVGVKMEL